ncbi:unnamed protein product, partial [Choristocarpus tenellus]
WVQCDECGKWRHLRADKVWTLETGAPWRCTMNEDDPQRAVCSAPEEDWVEDDGQDWIWSDDTSSRTEVTLAGGDGVDVAGDNNTRNRNGGRCESAVAGGEGDGKVGARTTSILEGVGEVATGACTLPSPATVSSATFSTVSSVQTPTAEDGGRVDGGSGGGSGCVDRDEEIDMENCSNVCGVGGNGDRSGGNGGNSGFAWESKGDRNAVSDDRHDPVQPPRLVQQEGREAKRPSSSVIKGPRGHHLPPPLPIGRVAVKGGVFADANSEVEVSIDQVAVPATSPSSIPAVISSACSSHTAVLIPSSHTPMASQVSVTPPALVPRRNIPTTTAASVVVGGEEHRGVAPVLHNGPNGVNRGGGEELRGSLTDDRCDGVNEGCRDGVGARSSSQLVLTASPTLVKSSLLLPPTVQSPLSLDSYALQALASPCTPCTPCPPLLGSLTSKDDAVLKKISGE